MDRLVCVSNRVGPLKDSAKAGGLAVGLVDALKENGGIWFGWSGSVTEEGTHGPLHREEVRRVTMATIDVSPADYEDFYVGYSNKTLWPVLHFRLDLADFDRRFEEAYARINQRFAARLRPLIEPNDTIWVHDYHFMRLGAELRDAGVENPIGFFLHIPFPPPEIVSALPRCESLVRAMLAFDLIGFQTEADRKRFARFVVEELGGKEHPGGRIVVRNRSVATGAFPIGIDPGNFARFAESEEAKQYEGRLRRILDGRLQIIGVDRLDYSKGLPERFRAFERLLEDYPSNRGNVSLLQIAPLSRSDVDAYTEIQAELEGLSGHINGRFADFDWQPIRLITKPFQRRTLAGLLRASRVGIVTPLRDGMNLVAKEFIAAQDPEDPGVLLLSRFAGAAEEMREALIVNPHSMEGVSEALQAALHMPLDERRARWMALNERITKNDAANWRTRFLDALANAAEARRGTSAQVG